MLQATASQVPHFNPIDYRVDLLMSGARILEQAPLADVLFNKNLFPLRGSLLNLATAAGRAVTYVRRNGDRSPSRFFNTFPVITQQDRDALNALLIKYGQRLIEKGYALTSVAAALYALHVGSFPIPYVSQDQVNVMGEEQRLQVAPTYGKRVGRRVNNSIFEIGGVWNRKAFKQYVAGIVTIEFNRTLDSLSDDDAGRIRQLLPEVWVPQDFHAIQYGEYPVSLRRSMMTNFELVSTFGMERPALDKKVHEVSIKGAGPITMMELYEVHEEDALTVFVRVSFEGTKAQDLAVMHVDRGITWSHMYGEAAYSESQLLSAPILHVAQNLYATLAGSVPNTGTLNRNSAGGLAFDVSAFAPPNKYEFTESGIDRLENIQPTLSSGLKGTEPVLSWLGTPSEKQWEALRIVSPNIAEYLEEGR